MKICILGCASSWAYAPFNDESIEIWGLNAKLINSVPRFNRWFDVHIPNKYIKSNPIYSKWLLDNQNNLWIMNKCDLYPNANIIDYKYLVNKYGDYFTCSMAWMMALALENKDLTDIYLCGVDLNQKQEYEQQRPCVEYFIGIAKGKGIKVHVQQTSSLLKSKGLYGII